MFDIPIRIGKFGGAVACGAGAWFFYAAGAMTKDPKYFATAAGCGVSMVWMASEAFKPNEE